jgi:hypothetical protein
LPKKLRRFAIKFSLCNPIQGKNGITIGIPLSFVDDPAAEAQKQVKRRRARERYEQIDDPPQYLFTTGGSCP